MLSPAELLDYKTRPKPSVYSIGRKETEVKSCPFDAAQLEAKLKNIQQLIAMERVRMVGMVSRAEWLADLQKALVTHQTGPYWSVFGHFISSKKYLDPEEALYLVDIGALELTYKDVPLSLQRAYYLLLTGDMSLEKYRVFSHLSILGYKVMRHSSKNVLTKYEKDIDVHKIGIKHKHISEDNDIRCQSSHITDETLTKEKTSELAANQAADEVLPLKFSDDETKITVCDKIKGIGPKKMAFTATKKPPVDFDAFLPGDDVSKFRKSTIQLPAFRLRVFLGSDPAPNLVELCREQTYFQDGVPLVLAVVHPDCVSFLQIAAVDIPDVP